MFQLRKSIGDGNCLFRSLGYLLQVNHEHLRHGISKIIKRNPDLIINGEEIYKWVKWSNSYSKDNPRKICKEYARRMKKNGTWGTGLEIMIVAFAFGRTIHVMRRQNKKYIQVAEYFPEFGNDIYLLWYGAHYDALIPT